MRSRAASESDRTERQSFHAVAPELVTITGDRSTSASASGASMRQLPVPILDEIQDRSQRSSPIVVLLNPGPPQSSDISALLRGPQQRDDRGGEVFGGVPPSSQ